jgi:hypothetical protein
MLRVVIMHATPSPFLYRGWALRRTCNRDVHRDRNNNNNNNNNNNQTLRMVRTAVQYAAICRVVCRLRETMPSDAWLSAYAWYGAQCIGIVSMAVRDAELDLS